MKPFRSRWNRPILPPIRTESTAPTTPVLQGWNPPSESTSRQWQILPRHQSTPIPPATPTINQSVDTGPAAGTLIPAQTNPTDGNQRAHPGTPSNRRAYHGATPRLYREARLYREVAGAAVRCVPGRWLEFPAVEICLGWDWNYNLVGAHFAT